jgi:hypothetical protein
VLRTVPREETRARANGHAGDGPRVAVTGGDAGLEHALLRFRLAW